MISSTDDEEVKSLVDRINCNTELFHCKNWPYLLESVPYSN